jgi:hypothetical protein
MRCVPLSTIVCHGLSPALLYEIDAASDYS